MNTQPSTSSLPKPFMLWRYSLNAYSGFIDSDASITAARQALAEKIKADPFALIGKLEPAEPTPHTLLDLGKRVFNLKT